MQGRGKAYEPNITKALVAMLGIYPMGAVVMLDDGATAVVYRVNNDDLLHPRVKVLIDAERPLARDARGPRPAPRRHDDRASRSTGWTACVSATEAGVDDVWEYL